MDETGSILASCPFFSFLCPFILILVLQAEYMCVLVTRCSTFQLCALKPLFVRTIYHLSGLAEEGTHLLSLADVATLLLFNYSAACFLETTKTNKPLFEEAGRR